MLRANEIEKENKLNGNHQQPVLKEINFMDGKLKAMCKCFLVPKGQVEIYGVLHKKGAETFFKKILGGEY